MHQAPRLRIREFREGDVLPPLFAAVFEDARALWLRTGVEVAPDKSERIAGVGGLLQTRSILSPAAIAFLNVEMPHWRGPIVYRLARMMMAEAKRLRLPHVVALADSRIAGADRLLDRLGFQPIAEAYKDAPLLATEQRLGCKAWFWRAPDRSADRISDSGVSLMSSVPDTAATMEHA